MSQRRDAIVCDVDGTLALRNGRGPYDWRDGDTDLPHKPVILALSALHRTGLEILYVSGRPDLARSITEAWLLREVQIAGPLFMRSSDDSRKDAEVKREIFMKHIEPHFNVVAVFDDRDQVVRMWREDLGLTCFQVAPGDF